MRLEHTDSHHSDFKLLVKELDNTLAVTDGDDHAFYDQFNKLNHLNNVIVAYEDGIPVGCGALKKYDTQSMEIKRMYTRNNYRGKGIASSILNELENWTAALGFKRCILETGVNQREAIALYKKSGYELIKNYGPYAGVENSFCFEKKV
ncbi:GNAT family N-acetyltransferase [Nonlabens sp.]|uniref:GNAT family N-acetyltransferase n=1 Tax=Nonlabens sp. TaxID=1888209 RepID=UPI003F6992BB